MKMDFQFDDDIGSDDSFFEEPKVLAKRSSITKTPEKKVKESLDTKPKSAGGIFEDTKKVETGNRKAMDDWLTDTSKDISKQEKTKKTDFLDDLFPMKPKPEKKGTSLDNILKDSKAASSVKSTFNPESSTSELGLSAVPTERRRGTRRGSGVENSLGLGLFSDDYQYGDFYTKDKKEIAPIPQDSLQKTNTSSGIPDWLGVAPKRSQTPVITKTVEKPTSLNITKEYSEKPSEVENISIGLPEIKSAINVSEAPSGLIPQDINTGIQNTYSALHQQESLLLVSLQFKKYEEVLKEIQDKQKEILGQQEKQFKNFIDEYILKQQMVENNIRLQQERINNQIKVLVNDNVAKTSDIKFDDQESAVDKENSIHDLTMRKLKQRHEEEMFLMEESYKKQMDILEKSALNIEENLREELKNVINICEEKLRNVKTNKEEEIAYYKEKMEFLEEQHKNEIKLLKDVHIQKLEEVKTEHAIQIDYIKEMKLKEKELLNDGYALTQKIDTGINMLSHNTKVLQEMEGKVVENYDVLSTSREISIRTKEQEILLTKKMLEKSREAAENEKIQLLSLVRNLEMKLAEQNVNAKEDRWALQQAAATLMARSKALEREAEFSNNLIEREKEQLKTLKESLLLEQEKMVMQLTEEKLQLASEKAKFETSTKLINSYEVERAKVEAETVIREAKALTERLNQERSLLQRQKSELTNTKQNLDDRERGLDEKEVELEFLMQDAQRKLAKDKQVLGEAKRMETTYKEKLKELQTQWNLLSNREKKLAEEKILLSRERLALYTAAKTSKDCVLCNTDDAESSFGKNIMAAYDKVKMPDPSLVKIRLEALDDEESEVSKEGSVSNK